MSRLLVGKGIQAARECFAGGAVACVSYVGGRGEDAVLNVERRAGGAPDITCDDFRPILPRGSDWEAIAGWRSYFVHPFSTKGREWWVVGAEGVMPNTSGGAYPIVEAFVYSDAVAIPEGLDRLANRLAPLRSGSALSWTGKRERYYFSIYSTPDDFQLDESRILEYASGRIRNGGRPLVRTLALDESRLPWVRIRAIDAGESLTGIAGPVQQRFSVWTRLKLNCIKFWYPET